MLQVYKQIVYPNFLCMKRLKQVLSNPVFSLTTDLLFILTNSDRSSVLTLFLLLQFDMEYNSLLMQAA